MDVRLYNMRVMRDDTCYKATVGLRVVTRFGIDTYKDVIFKFDRTGRLLNDLDVTSGEGSNGNVFDMAVADLWNVGAGKRLMVQASAQYRDFNTYDFPALLNTSHTIHIADSERAQIARDAERFNVSCAIDAALAAKDKQLFTELVEKRGWYL